MKKKEKIFRVILAVKSASGYQAYDVPAKSLAEAKAIWAAHSGDFECVDEEIEVTDVEEPEFKELP